MCKRNFESKELVLVLKSTPEITFGAEGKQSVWKINMWQYQKQVTKLAAMY